MMENGGGQFSLGHGGHHDVHAQERGRDNRGQSEERGESKWEYMGYGIWENSDRDDDDHAPAPSPGRGWSQERENIRNNGQQKMVNTSFSSTSTRRQMMMQENGHGNGHGTASTATAELDNLMTSLNKFKMDGERHVDEPVND